MSVDLPLPQHPTHALQCPCFTAGRRGAGARPGLSACGSDRFTVTVRDDLGGTTTQLITLTVTPVNDAPVVVLAIADLVVNEDAPTVVTNLTALFSDVETPATSLTYAIVANTNSALVSATLTQGTNLTLAFAPNGNGASQIAVRATDAGGLSVTNTFTVTLTPD